MERVTYFSSGGGKAKPMKQPEAVTGSVFLSSAVYFAPLHTKEPGLQDFKLSHPQPVSSCC